MFQLPGGFEPGLTTKMAPSWGRRGLCLETIGEPFNEPPLYWRNRVKCRRCQRWDTHGLFAQGPRRPGLEMDVELGDIRGQGGIAVGGSDKMLWDREASWRRCHLNGGLSTRYLGNRGRSEDSITDETEGKRKGKKHGENNILV